ncbi:urease accessory protein UreG [Lysinibacillus boronitolerans]|uniref:Urease accessory protein UreG n=1 Tax=Lysinibacillus boronitolerans JCM 21713 = 10a = NBRC 103108 TaxID=1294264 RepID=A0ABR4XT21_9BACI|nr:urease accessory protein UreG [Lysinibacillus boronitolerans]KGR80671.1 urease accessory protein UreG [Lysinibacillus boronitolerans JCM 21713 = 10a = NBRC 103108]
MKPVRIGIGGPVGSGKTSLVDQLTRVMHEHYNVAVITNDIYTREDAQYLITNGVLAEERIIGVETGGCPHTAIREDASMNFAAIDDLNKSFPDLDIIFIESGGDNLSATFSPELVHGYIYVIDVAEGQDIPRKGGPALTRSDLLLINKTSLAPHVGVDLELMDQDVKKMRAGRPYIFADVRSQTNVDKVVEWIQHHLLLEGAEAVEKDV